MKRKLALATFPTLFVGFLVLLFVNGGAEGRLEASVVAITVVFIASFAIFIGALAGFIK